MFIHLRKRSCRGYPQGEKLWPFCRPENGHNLHYIFFLHKKLSTKALFSNHFTNCQYSDIIKLSLEKVLHKRVCRRDDTQYLCAMIAVMVISSPLKIDRSFLEIIVLTNQPFVRNIHTIQLFL